MKINKWVIALSAIVVACLHHHTYNRHLDLISNKQISMPVSTEEMPNTFDLLPDMVMWYIVTK
jgi:hypothetical protein